MATHDDDLASRKEFLKTCSSAAGRFYEKVWATAIARGFQYEIRHVSFSIRGRLQGRKAPVGFFQGYSEKTDTPNTAFLDLGSVRRYSPRLEERLRAELARFPVIEDTATRLPKIAIVDGNAHAAFAVFLFLLDRMDEAKGNS